MSKWLLKGVLSLALISSFVGVAVASEAAPGEDPVPPVVKPK